MQKLSLILVALLGLASFSAQADTNTAQQLANDYGAYAKKLNPKVTLSAEAGRAFYTQKVEINGKDMSCAACHTDNPANAGKHNESGKAIKPMSPSANPDRFKEVQKSQQGFTKHCKDLYGKDCKPEDKANFISYLLTVK